MVEIGQTIKEPYSGNKVEVTWIGDTWHGGDQIVSVALPGRYQRQNRYFLSEIEKANQRNAMTPTYRGQRGQSTLGR